MRDPDGLAMLFHCVDRENVLGETIPTYKMDQARMSRRRTCEALNAYLRVAQQASGQRDA